MKSNARKRAHFPHRKGWYENRNGNPQIKIGAYRVTIFKKASGWGGVVNHPSRSNGTFTREKFDTLETAQRAAFDALTFLQDELGK